MTSKLLEISTPEEKKIIKDMLDFPFCEIEEFTKKSIYQIVRLAEQLKMKMNPPSKKKDAETLILEREDEKFWELFLLNPKTVDLKRTELLYPEKLQGAFNYLNKYSERFTIDHIL
jgi:hypothetical protein